MMEKHSNERIPCTACDNDAVPGTNPPLCKECLQKQLDKKASEEPVKDEPKTLKELDAG